MDVETLILHFAVFIAALLQAATGMGFGIIAGPIILIAMNDNAAIQVSILLSLLIAVVLTPTLYKDVDRTLMRRFSIGVLAGLPLGMLVFVLITVDVLKLLAGLSVLFMVFLVRASNGRSKVTAASSETGQAPKPAQGTDGRALDFGAGAISGAMCSSLAMPGPVIAARMMALACPKAATRATILVLFVFSYVIATAVQAGTVGITWPTLSLTLILAPATLVGVVCGKLTAGHISEVVFRRILTVVLIATAVSLLLSAGSNVFDFG